jgi:hypothetical protein
MTESERWAFLTHQRYDLARTVAKWFFSTLMVFVAIPLPVLWGAGQSTAISLLYGLIIEGKPADKMQKALVIVLTALSLWQRRHYQRRLKHLGERTEELERKYDPGRSSSRPGS